jgi:hypothetical protein
VTVKLLALATLALLAPAGKPDVRFESDGIRIGDALVQGTVLELRGSGAAALLASGSSIEALAACIEVEAAPGRMFTLEPGIRVTRVEGGFRFSTHEHRRIRFAASGGAVTADSPAVLAASAEGWTLGDQKIAGLALRAGVEKQDEESNLERMKKSADQLRSGAVPKLSSRQNRLFRGNPLDGGQAVNSTSIRTIPQVSPSGAP